MSTIGVRFGEKMAGPFALGETEPDAGKAKGRREGSELTIRVKVEIDDLDRFIADPAHLGRLSGHFDFTPFGSDIEASRGVFNLFSPAVESGDPGLKLMVYELAFEYGGDAYYVAGKKEVRDDPGFDLWTDTTTLFTRLHLGEDKSGDVVGAGILNLGVTDLVELVSTMRATGVESATDSARALSRFGALFLGELWDSYVRHTR